MSDDLPPIPEPETPAAVEARAEAQAIRRRWITLGELVAIAAVVISGLTFWSNYSDRREAAAEEKAEKASEKKAAARVTLTASPASGGSALVLRDAKQAVQSIRVIFPSALGISAKESNLEPRIDAGWFDGKLLDLTDDGPDEREGSLPVLITAQWWDEDSQHSDTALYDIIWRTEGRVLQGRKLKLKGVVLKRRIKGDGTAELDTAWARAKPN